MTPLAALALLSLASAPSEIPPPLEAVQVVERLQNRVPDDLLLTTSDGRVVPLKSLLGTRPLVLSLVYYRCSALCNLLLGGLARSAAAMSWQLGREYDLVSVSIDSTETPPLAAERRRGFLQAAGAPSATAWPFMTASDETIDRLAEAIGFQFQRIGDQRQFAHAAAVVVLTPDGRVSRYLYGLEFDRRQLELALFEAAAGRVGTSWQRILLRCYRYDTATRRYHSVIARYFRIGGTLVLLLVGGMLAWLWRNDLRRGRL